MKDLTTATDESIQARIDKQGVSRARKALTARQIMPRRTVFGLAGAWICAGPAVTWAERPYDPASWSASELIELQLQRSAGVQPATFTGQAIVIDPTSAGLFRSPAGQLKLLMWDEVLAAEPLAEQFAPLSVAKLEKELTSQPGVAATSSDRFIVLHRGQPAYASWMLGMCERLHRGFYQYWSRTGVDLRPGEFPLVVNVFANRTAYLEHAAADGLGESAGGMLGYYHQETNQTVTYDLTDAAAIADPRVQNSPRLFVEAIRRHPGGERMVATMIHEIVHQLAYNSGLQVRLADNPLWLSEGIAMYFETPDLASSLAWTGIGKPNEYQLGVFATLPNSDDWITPLISDNAMFESGATIAAAYARSYVLTSFLLRAQTRPFAAYMAEIGSLTPLVVEDPAARLERFQRLFGGDLSVLSRQATLYAARL